MAWTCIIKGKEIGDVDGDRRNSQKVEQYSISKQAVYMNGQYLPVSEIRCIRVQPSVFRPRHSCGIGIPVFKIRLDYGGEKPVVLMIEDEDNADKVVSLICTSNTDIATEYYFDPRTGMRPERISPPLY